MTDPDISNEFKRRMISWVYPGDKWLRMVERVSPERVEAIFEEVQPKLQGLKHVKPGVRIRRSRETIND